MKNPKKHQQGISLYVVIILVLLSMLLALWSSRTALLNELIVGNDADYQRTFEAAQAMLEDAQNDILIEKNKDHTTPTIRENGGKILFPDTKKEFDDIFYSNLDLVENICTNAICKCKNAICTKITGAQDFWIKAANFDKMTASNVGARYGEFTGASAGAISNPILGKTESGQGAWYWIEVMKFSPKNNLSVLTDITAGKSTNTNFIYRITAIARGLKSSSQVVLQSTITFSSSSGE